MDGRVAQDVSSAPARTAPHEGAVAQARPEDTSVELPRRPPAEWKTMTPLERVTLAAEMSMAMAASARAVILAEEPDANESRVRYLLAQRRYGTEIANAAFGVNGRWPQQAATACGNAD